jgi:hypothetical protein
MFPVKIIGQCLYDAFSKQSHLYLMSAFYIAIDLAATEQETFNFDPVVVTHVMVTCK